MSVIIYPPARLDGGGSSGSDTSGFLSPFFHIRDVKSNGTNGGTLVSGARRTHDLNTIIFNEITGADLDDLTSTVLLPAGIFYTEGFSVTFSCSVVEMALYNITLDEDIPGLMSPNTYSIASDNTAFHFFSGKFELLETTQLELQVQSAATGVATGFGVAKGFGTSEIYADLKFWQLA